MTFILTVNTFVKYKNPKQIRKTEIYVHRYECMCPHAKNMHHLSIASRPDQIFKYHAVYVIVLCVFLAAC